MISPRKFSVFKNQKIIHAYSTRTGGVSKGAFSSLNLGRSTPDNIDSVYENRRLFFKHLDILPENLAIPRQTHSDNVKTVRASGSFENTDALITNMPGIILTIQTADCFPVFIYDYKEHICAIVHSGWRGAAKKIVLKTLNKMVSDFSCKAGNMLIAIGAGIQQKNYQVDEETAKNFDSEFLIPDGKNHFKLDVQGAIIKQIKECGVAPNNLEIDTTCTFEDKENYFSYRRDGQFSGRMMGVIGLL